MGEIKFVALSEVAEEQIIGLMNNARVGKHLPLLVGEFTAEQCKDFLRSKKQLWDDYGYGPWAFCINNEFAGWGGLQAENGGADFALVLHPKYWGWGRKIFNKIRNDAFGQMNLSSISVLFPPDRPNAQAIMRLGFIEDETLIIDGHVFKRFRLYNPIKSQ